MVLFKIFQNIEKRTVVLTDYREHIYTERRVRGVKSEIDDPLHLYISPWTVAAAARAGLKTTQFKRSLGGWDKYMSLCLCIWCVCVL